MKKNHQFNLIKLEKNLNSSYSKFITDGDAQSKNDMFLHIWEITFAIATINYGQLDTSEITNEYSLRLYERIVVQGFRFSNNNDHIPFTAYIRLNIRDVVYPNKNNHIGLIEDTLKYVDGEDINTARRLLVERLIGVLRGLEPKFDKLIPLALESILRSKYQPVNSGLPRDLHVFTITLIGVAKRLTDDHIEIRSKVGMKSNLLLLTLLNTDIVARELLLSMDLKSLYRLCTIAGGTKIRIPTIRQLETLLNASDTVFRVINGEELEKASRESKKDLELVLSNRTDVIDIIGKIAKIYEHLKPDVEVSPTIDTLTVSQDALISHYSSLDYKGKAKVRPILEGQLEALKKVLGE